MYRRHRAMVVVGAMLSALFAPIARGQVVPSRPVPSQPLPASAAVEFEVATIRPADPSVTSLGVTIHGREFATLSTSMTDLLGFAYGFQAKQIVGGPDWASKEKYTVRAVTSGEGQPTQPTEDQWRTMIGKLVEQRFQLKFHHEKRELAVFALSVAKGGPKNLTKSTSDSLIPLRLAPRWVQNGMQLQAQNVSMWNFLELLQAAVVDRPVVDQTGLAGRYDFDLKWMPSQSEFGGRFARTPEIPNAAPPLSTAMQEQIGLRLDPVKASADVLVIDQAEKPSEN